MLDHAPSPQRLRDLATSLDNLDLRAAGETVDVRRRRAAIASGDYLAPRLEDPRGSLAVLVAGPGGGGKSTIVNSLARRNISETGPLRPTTREPVAWTAGEMPATLDVLRTRIPGSIVDSLRPPPDGIVLIDAPPPEVVDTDGRPIVHELLEVVDAVVFVAGPTRYADADAMDLLGIAAARGLPTIMVLNRLPRTPEMQQMIASDFASKLAERRLLPRPDAELVVTVAESTVSTETGALVAEEVARVRKELEAMADPQSRPDVIAASVEGTLRRLRGDLAMVRAGVIDREVRRVELLDPMRAMYRDEGGRLVAEVKGGTFAAHDEGSVLSVMASAAARRSGLAARATAEVWATTMADLVDANPDLFSHGRDTLTVARDRLEFWMSEVEALIDRMASRRLSARRGRKLAAHVRRAALDPRIESTRSESRLLVRVPGIVDAARDLLAEELRGIVDADSRRFEDAIGSSTPDGVLAELTEVANDE